MRFEIAMSTLVLALVGCTNSVEKLDGDGLVVLEGQTLIDGTGATPIPGSVVVLHDDRIIKVGVVGQYSYPSDAVVRDLRGKWIVPGFIDTHAHMPEPVDPDHVALRILVAFGITNARVPAGIAEDNVKLREEIKRGVVLGPRIQTAGRVVDRPNGTFAGSPTDELKEVSTVEEIRAEVRRQANESVDYVKLYTGIGPELAKAAIDEAHSLGLRVLGHLGSTTWTQASSFGIDGIVHSGIYGTPWELAPESSWESIRLAISKGSSPGDEVGFQTLRKSVLADGPEIQNWARNLVEHRTPVEPNLVLMQAVIWGNDRSVLGALEPENVPPSWRKDSWMYGFPHPYSSAKTAEWSSEAQKTYALFEQLAVLLYRSGAILTVGTDMMNPWMTPGVAFHREMQLLSEAGLSPAEVLVSATRNGAIAMGIDDQVGTIEEGMVANLIVLSADPTTDITNTRKIESVCLRGKCLNRDELLDSDRQP
jgi:imidazolonepropionase-like amidohydrolase